MLTLFQAEDVIKALQMGQKWGSNEGYEQSSHEEYQFVQKAISYVLRAIKDGMPIGEHEDDVKAAAEESEEGMKPWQMRDAYMGR